MSAIPVFFKRVIILFLLILIVFADVLFAKDIWSGEVRTRQSFLYGRIEMRMRSAEASGVTSTLFTYNVSNSTYNEIDIEIMGRFNNQVSYNTFTPDKSGNPFSQLVNFNPHRAFHIYAIEWTPDYVAWYVDGFEIYRQNNARIKDLNLPQAIMMNFWPPSSVDWAGVLNMDKLPLYAYYDWIKYYKYDPTSSDGFTFQWQDDFNSFDQNRWIASNSTFGSNLSDFKAGNVVVQDGYLILCMRKQGETGYTGGSVKDIDIDAPYIVHAKAYDKNISVLFSENLDAATAEIKSNYIIPGVAVNSARLQEDGRTVILNVQEISRDISNNLIVTGIKDLAASPNIMSAKSAIIKFLPSLPLKVNLGGENSGGFISGQVWDFSKDYGTIGGSPVNNLADISAASDKEIYKSAVEDITSFKMRAPDGNYKVTLMLAETKFSAVGSRVFDIYSNGKLIKEDLDIFKLAGLNTSCEVTLQDITARQGMLEIYFKDKVDKPVICGIKIETQATRVDLGSNIIPGEFNLSSFPNPFNPSTKIVYSIPFDASVNIKIYDLLGSEVSKLMDEFKPKGSYDIVFNGKDLRSGIYFCRLKSGDLIKTIKLLMIK